MWYVTGDTTHDTWQMTHGIWHMTCGKHCVKSQVPSSNGLEIMVFWRFVGRIGDLISESITEVFVEPIQNTVVQSIELQGNRGGTGKSPQNSSGTGIAKFAGAAPLMTVQMTANTGVASVKGVPRLKWCLRGMEALE